MPNKGMTWLWLIVKDPEKRKGFSTERLRDATTPKGGTKKCRNCTFLKVQIPGI